MLEELKSLQPLDHETPNAYQAFCDYVGMGYQRSIRTLHERYTRNTHESPTIQYKTLSIWSRKYQWQRRINEYQHELALTMQMNRVEAFNAHIEKALLLADHLLGDLTHMINNFQSLRVTHRQIIDDPRDVTLPVDQRRQIESIQTKVNVGDLQKLIAAYGTLNKDLRAALGLPIVTELKGVEPMVMKTYISVSPDDWDTEITSEI